MLKFDLRSEYTAGEAGLGPFCPPPAESPSFMIYASKRGNTHEYIALGSREKEWSMFES